MNENARWHFLYAFRNLMVAPYAVRGDYSELPENVHSTAITYFDVYYDLKNNPDVPPTYLSDNAKVVERLGC